MISPVASTYQLHYVGLSYAVSVIGSLVALHAAGRIRRRDGAISTGHTAAAGLALGGIGVWSMHFIGMVALKLEAASSYSLWETMVSLVAAVMGSALALGFVARAPERPARTAAAGFVLGMGVVVMHYLGMFGMKIAGYIRWDYGVVAISAVVAVAAATAALWLAFNVHSRLARVLAAAIMGVAVCAMHYTGMHAAEFICTGDPSVAPHGFGLFGAGQLPAIVTFVALTTAATIVVYHVYRDSVDDLDQEPAASRFA